MHPIYVMAVVTTGVAISAVGLLIRQMARPSIRMKLLALFAAGLVMSPAAYWLVRVPLKTQFEKSLEAHGWDLRNGSPELDAIRLTYAPLTEEPAKVLPWLIMLGCGIRLLPVRRMVAPLALTIGLSFATGEIWLVAGFVAGQPGMDAIPWYQFGGFLSERLMTCFSHSLFALPFVWCLRRGVAWSLLGLLCGMCLHFLGNAPIVLMQREALGIERGHWAILVQIWLIVLSVGGVIVLMGVHAGRGMIRRIWKARMICPGCGATYRQPILMGLNAGLWRYEPCGACHKWHWVSLQHLAPPEEPPNQQG